MAAIDAARGPGWADELPTQRTVHVESVIKLLAGARRLVVLDDDPTGTQTVRGVPVLTSWQPDDIAWAFRQGGAGFFILTNTRSLSAQDAAERNREIGARCLDIAASLGIAVVFASRSDSTLRGHFPLETDVLAQVSAERGEAIDGILMSPAYLDAGRVTLDGVHWLRSPQGLTPVSSSEFARDATFGYASSILAEWVEEKSDARILAVSVAVVTLDDIRTGSASLAAPFLDATGGQVLVVDAIADDDLRAVTLAVLAAESEGKHLLYRVGPSFVRARLGQDSQLPIPSDELDKILGDCDGNGLVVVGSHVDVTSRQLKWLAETTAFTSIELDVAIAITEDVEAHIAEIVARAAHSLTTGLVVISTSRERVTGTNADESLEFSRRVSAALAETVRRTVELRRPRYVVAKGGITSSDIATSALGIDRAWVRGSLLPGIVSLWQAASGRSEGIPYVVFAGNVGGDDSLAEVIKRLDR